ncbi:MAG: hypothetical protein ACRDFC_00070 [Ignavibacteria bacterium]
MEKINMFKIKNYLNLFFILMLSFIVIHGCGKKDDTSKTDGKTESKTPGDISDFSPDKPFNVEFEVAGTMTGKINGYYAGKKARIESTMSIQGQKMSSTAYSDGEMVYIVSEIAGIKTGMKMDAKKYAEMSSKKEGQVDITSFKDRLKDYSKEGTEEILGKKCDIYKSKDGSHKISVYKETIPLKFDFGKMTFTATKVETDVKVTDDMFTPPSDVKYIEMEEMMKGAEDMKDKMKNLDEKTKELEEQMKKYSK